MRLHLARPASLVLFVATLLPAAARAQSVAESAGADLVAGALPRTCLSCGGFLPQRRLEPPAREVSLRVGATLVGQGLAGPASPTAASSATQSRSRAHSTWQAAAAARGSRCCSSR